MRQSTRQSQTLSAHRLSENSTVFLSEMKTILTLQARDQMAHHRGPTSKPTDPGPQQTSPHVSAPALFMTFSCHLKVLCYLKVLIPAVL